MGMGSSKIGGAMKRLVSPQARKAHQEQQARVQQRIADAKANVLARREAGNKQFNQQVNELLEQVQDEVNLEHLAKLRQSLPDVPRYQPQVNAKPYQRRQ